MSYKSKYLKYKQKYINLKKQLGGNNTYTITVKEPWFTFIKEGKKKVEGRLNRGLFQKINKGDIIIWIHGDKRAKVKVTDKRKYNSFREMINAEKLDKILPSIKTIDDGVKIYRQYFNEHDEKTNGVVAIEMELMNNEIMHILPIQNPKSCPVFDYIKSGVKKVEGRKYSQKYHNYKPGDVIQFICGNEKIKKTIKDIRLYKTLDNYLEHEGYNKVLPCTKSIEEAIKIYNMWSNENERNILLEKYGYSFMAIELS